MCLYNCFELTSTVYLEGDKATHVTFLQCVRQIFLISHDLETSMDSFQALFAQEVRSEVLESELKVDPVLVNLWFLTFQ